MPATTDPYLRRVAWNPTPDISRHYNLQSAPSEEDPIMNDPDVVAQLQAYPGNSPEDEAIRQSIIDEAREVASLGPVGLAERRIRQYMGNAAVTPGVEYSRALSEEVGCEVYLMREDQQDVGSFKGRGAKNVVFSHSAEQRSRGYMAVSAGNHAQGVAHAAHLVGAKATIFMPANTPEVKVEATRAWGAEVVLVEGNLEDTFAAAGTFQELHPTVNYVHPFDDRQVIEGQGTAAYQALEAVPDLSHFIVPAGGGGLAAGTVLALEEKNGSAEVWTAEPEGAACVARALTRGRREKLRMVHTHAEGATPREMGREPFDVLYHTSVPVQPKIVSENRLISTTLRANEMLGRVECTAALGLAALLAYQEDLKPTDKVLVMVTGRHITDEKLGELAQIEESNNRLTMVS